MSNPDNSIYSRALQGITAPFRDLAFFTDAGLPLTINPQSRASLVRVSLRGAGALSLTGVQVGVRGDTGEPIRLASAEVRTSARPDERVALALAGEPKSARVPLVEVARSDDPWVIIDLGQAYDLVQIKLWSAAMPRQGWAPLTVEVSEDGSSWTAIYSTADRLAAQAAHVVSVGAQGTLAAEDPAAWTVFIDVVQLLVGGHRTQAEKRLKLSELPTDTIAAIRQAISQAFLNPMQLDWNHHGVRRTFKYWTKGEKVKYIKAANEFIDNLARELSPHVCLGFGSVLSLVRDQDLIPHDDDLDIIIAFDRNECPTIREGLQRVVDFAGRHDYKVREPFPKSHRQLVRKGTKKVDVFVSLHDNGRISWFPQKRDSLAMTDVFPPIRASMLGVECLVPANPLRYLESVYGPTWSKPDPSFAHNWRTKAYDDIW